MPPPLQSRITWLPRLSARKRWAVDSCRMGLLIKVRVIIVIIIIIIFNIIIIIILQVILHYDRPHWRLAGLSGELVSTGTVCIAFDDSAEAEADTEDTEGGGGAALVAFVGGDPAVRAADLGEAELVAEVVEHLGSTLGSWAHMYTGAGDHGPLHVRQPSTVQRPR